MSANAPVIAEPLEPRRLLSATPEMVADINTASSGSSPGGEVSVGGSIFFSASDVTTGPELWKTDGTADGTVLVKDIAPGVFGSSPNQLTNFSGALFFTATQQDGQAALWRSDGTAAGTLLVKSFGKGVLSRFTIVNGALFFLNSLDFFGTRVQLWRSDGTAVGTAIIKDYLSIPYRSPVSLPPSPPHLSVVGDTIYFFAGADANATSADLWKSDGTVTGTVPITTGAPFQSAEQPTAVSDTLFFTARRDLSEGIELWKSDGTAAGTSLLKDIAAGIPSSVPTWLTPVGDKLFFTAEDPEAGRELWSSDGTPAGTSRIKDIFPFGGTSLPANLSELNGSLYFTATDNYTTGLELWKSDGTPDGTIPLAVISPGAVGREAGELTVVNGTLYFAGLTASHDIELWRSDGTAAGTRMVKDAFPGTVPSQVKNLSNVNGTLYFAGGDAQTGAELWRSDGTDAGTVLVKEIRKDNLGIGSSSYAPPVELNGAIYFGAQVGNETHSDSEIWRSDSTVAETSAVTDLESRGAFLLRDSLFRMRNALYFFVSNSGAASAEVASGLWKSDGTPAGTKLVTSVPLVQSGSVGIVPMIVNGECYFLTSSFSAIGVELWKTDGTAEGTVLVKHIGPAGTAIGQFVNANGTLYLTTRNAAGDRQLWKSDGTTDGTVPVAFVQPPTMSRGSAASLDGIFYFVNSDATGGMELWRSDGTAAGTTTFADLVPGSGSSNPSSLTVSGGLLYFVAHESSGSSLWRTDGTVTGTFKVGYVDPYGSTSDVDMVDVGGDLYFAAVNAAGVLWKSDGTPEGTVAVAPTVLRNRTYPSDLTNINGTLYLTAGDTQHGRELWKTDGTDAGTIRLSDINPGPADSNPANMTVAGGKLFFTADDGVHGQELWKLDLATPQPPPTLSSVVVGDGSSQRSQIKSLTLSFDEPVALAAGAATLRLLNASGSGANDGSAPTDASGALAEPASADGGKTWVFTFVADSAFVEKATSGASTGSLIDGIYRVSVDPAKVTAAGGIAMSAAPQPVTFHRLFGDVNGNGTVNNLDYGLFRNTFGRGAGQAGYEPTFDFDGNAVVNNADYGQFRTRYGRVLVL